MGRTVYVATYYIDDSVSVSAFVVAKMSGNMLTLRSLVRWICVCIAHSRRTICNMCTTTTTIAACSNRIAQPCVCDARRARQQRRQRDAKARNVYAEPTRSPLGPPNSSARRTIRRVADDACCCRCWCLVCAECRHRRRRPRRRRRSELRAPKRSRRRVCV